MNDKKKLVNAFMAKAQKNYGTDSIKMAGDNVADLMIRRVPTPSVDFNNMLDGGIAKGKIIEFYGPNSSGKTLMALQIIALEQKKDPDYYAGWFETESSFDPEVALNMGVDLDRLTVVDQKDFKSSEYALEVIRAMVTSALYGMIVVNSVAGIVPEQEMVADLNKQQVALVARLMSKLMRVITAAAAKNDCTLLFINQLRVNVGVMYGDPNTTTGGMAIGFFATQRVGFSQRKLDSNDPIDVTEGVKIGCRVKKNRLAKGNPYKDCVYYARYGIGIDNTVMLPKYLVEQGHFRKSGAWIYFDAENLKWNGNNALLDYFAQNPDFQERMLDLVSGTSTVVSVDADTAKAMLEEETAAEQAFEAMTSEGEE